MNEPRILSVESERKRIASQIAALREWEQQRLCGGTEVTLRGGSYALRLVPQHKQSPRHGFFVGFGGSVPVLFQNLPCGLLSRQRGLERVSRTDSSGCIWGALADGEYSLRFVNEVHDQVDVEILAQLAMRGDPLAPQNLQAAACDDRLPHDVSDYLTERIASLSTASLLQDASGAAGPSSHEAAGPSSHEVVQRTSTLWTSPVPVVHDLVLDSGGTGGLAPELCWGLTGDAKHIAIDCPFEKFGGSGFPFGCASVEYLAEDRHVAAAALMPVERNRELGRFQSSLPVARLLPGGMRTSEPGRLVLWEIRDDDDAWNRLTSYMVEALFLRPEVNADADLLARLSRLRLALKDDELLATGTSEPEPEPESSDAASARPGDASVVRKAWAGEQRVMDFPLRLGAASEDFPRHAMSSTSGERFGQDGNRIFIRCDVDEIPTGLCRLEIKESDGTVTRYYPKFTRVLNHWVFLAPIQEILGRDPSSRRVEVAVIAATAENVREFNSDGVRRIVAGWPANSSQRQLAESFLGITHA